MKKCVRCKDKKEAGAFARSPRHRDGLFPWCKKCHSAYQRARRKSNPRTKVLEAERRKRRQENTEIRERYLSYMTLYSLKRRYGIDAATVKRLIDLQKGVCAICLKAPERGRRRGLHVDHDHRTGIVRGLLCDSCNVALGRLRDSSELLSSAIRYLADPPGVKLHG